MPIRTLRCGECGEDTIIPNGDWNESQRPVIERWLEEHRLRVHDGCDGTHELELDPFRD